MNILVTGAFGHIGSYFVNRFKINDKIKKIYVIDNNYTQKFNLFLNKDFKNKIYFRVKDLTKKNSLKNLPKIKIIIHLASITNAEESLKQKKFIYENNYRSFKNIVTYCKKNKCKLIHISSTSIYGSQSLIVDENCKHLLPQSPYAEIKLKEENYLKKTKISYVTLRFGTIVGVSLGMRFHTAVNQFCYNAIMGNPIKVWQTAIDQYRPYLSIRDAYKTIMFVINNHLFDRQIYNIVTKNLTVRQVINLIKKYKKNIKIKYTKSRIMNQLSYKVMSTKIQRSGLNLSKNIQLDIKDTFKFFKNIKIF
jgi:nucleoside-diphosphate-sugar epimerase